VPGGILIKKQISSTKSLFSGKILITNNKNGHQITKNIHSG
jgi:hypothetical protein